MKLPDGWEVHHLGELFSSRKEKGIEGLPTLSVTINDGLVDRSSIERKTDTNLSPQEHLLIHKGDLAYNMMRMWQGAFGLADYDGLVSPAYVVLLPTEHVDSKFAYYLFKSSRIIYLFWAYSYGLTGDRLRLYFNDFTKIKHIIPPFSEQKAIADLLSTWDEAIEKTERLIRVKEKQLNAYGKELFDRKNEGKPDGWKLIALKDILTEHKNKSNGDEEVYSVSINKGLVNQVEHLGRSVSAANTGHYNQVHYGDIVYTKSPTGDFPFGIVKQSHTRKDVIVSPLYGVFKPIDFSLGVMIDFYFSSPTRARNYLFPIIQKGAKNTIAITNKTFLSKKLYLPLDKETQKTVSEYAFTAKQEIDLLKQLVEKYKTQKRGLMQKLLTGEWRVKDEIISKYMET